MLVHFLQHYWRFLHVSRIYPDQTDAAFMTPPLTTIRQPAKETGPAAARSLLARLRDESYDLPELAATLVVRESVRRFP